MSQNDDMISRQAAINAVEFGITYAKAIDVNTGESKELFKEGNDALKKASERIKDLPSAQPERETAKFIRWMECKKTDNYISYTPHCKCSKCGTEFIITTIKYCYMCGARMEQNNEGD